MLLAAGRIARGWTPCLDAEADNIAAAAVAAVAGVVVAAVHKTEAAAAVRKAEAAAAVHKTEVVAASLAGGAARHCSKRDLFQSSVAAVALGPGKW